LQFVYFTVVFNEIIKNNIFVVFYYQKIKEDLKCFGGKFMQKLEEKALKKKLKIGTAHLARKTGSTRLLA